ncbi:MAG: hypothetical protein KGS46_10965 [Chloroflexi bacterium]|nr:hypothetical protein [Chloroflexota bacterium]
MHSTLYFLDGRWTFSSTTDEGDRVDRHKSSLFSQFGQVGNRPIKAVILKD